MNSKTILYPTQWNNKINISNPGKDISSIVLLELPPNLAWVSLRIGMEWIRLSHLEPNVNLLDSVLCENTVIPVSLANFCKEYLEFYWEPQYKTETRVIKVPMYSEETYLQRNEDGDLVQEPIVTGYTHETCDEKIENIFQTPPFEVTWVDPVHPGTEHWQTSIYEDYAVGPSDTEYMNKLREKPEYGIIEMRENHIRLKNTLYCSHNMMGRRIAFGLPYWVRKMTV